MCGRGVTDEEAAFYKVQGGRISAATKAVIDNYGSLVMTTVTPWKVSCSGDVWCCQYQTIMEFTGTLGDLHALGEMSDAELTIELTKRLTPQIEAVKARIRAAYGW